MSMMDMDMDNEKIVQIKVVGVGGGGCNAVNRMCEAGMRGAEFAVINTDLQVLNSSSATYKLQIGQKITKGQGAGGKPEMGQKAAEESREEITQLLNGTEMLFITAGMGGGTGTGAAPVIGEISRSMGILTIGVVTKPFAFEGRKRMEHAEAGIEELKKNVDALLVIPNERLNSVSKEKITLKTAFHLADNILLQAVQGISELINVTGMINLDFADVCTIMRDAGYAHMGVGQASGAEKAMEAAKMAIASPLLETSLSGAKGLIVQFIVPADIDLNSLNEASSMIAQEAHPDVDLIWGVAINEDLKDEIKVTVIATKFEPEGTPGYSVPAPAAKAPAYSAPAPKAPAQPVRPAAPEAAEPDTGDVFDWSRRPSAPAPQSSRPMFNDDDFDALRDILSRHN